MKPGKQSYIVAGVIAVLLPCLPLFCKSFSGDWINHCWMINYNARYFLHHGSFPAMFNTDRVIGMPFPMFYGYLFFPFMGGLSTVFDANITVRLFAILLFAAQFVLIYRTLARSTADRLLAFTAGSLVLWTIYPLTNLYHRWAVPEFFATGLLTIAFVLWLETLRSETPKQMRLWLNAAILCLAAAAGTHPITCVYGVPAFILFQLASLLLPRRRKLKEMAVAAVVPVVVSVACLTPWVMATAKFEHLTQISYGFCFGHYDLTIDNLPMRLSPIPVPSRFLAAKAKIENMCTRHLDAEANTPLLLVVVAALAALCFRRPFEPRRLFASTCMLVLSVVLIYFSVFKGMDKLGHIARCIQFKYRLVTYINLAMLASLLLACYRQVTAPALGSGESEYALAGKSAGAGLVGQDVGATVAHQGASGRTVLRQPGVDGFRNQEARGTNAQPDRGYDAGRRGEKTAGRPTDGAGAGTTFGGGGNFIKRPVLYTALALSFMGLLMKLCFTLYLRPIQPYLFGGQRSDAQLLKLPSDFYGLNDYSIPTYVAPLPYETFGNPKRIQFPVLGGAHFGEVGPASVTEPAAGLLTNVQVFPWNDLLEGGVAIARTRVQARDGLFAVLAPRPGVLSYRFEPKPAWSAWNSVHAWLFFLWIGFSVIILLPLPFPRRSPPEAQPSPLALGGNAANQGVSGSTQGDAAWPTTPPVN